MNIEDYRIVTGLSNAYIARLSKNQCVMLDPRRVITEGEILHLIDWWLEKKLSDTEGDTYFITLKRKPIIKLKRLK